MDIAIMGYNQPAKKLKLNVPESLLAKLMASDALGANLAWRGLPGP